MGFFSSWDQERSYLAEKLDFFFLHDACIFLFVSVEELS